MTQAAPASPTYLWPRWIFLRALGVGFIFAFLSLSGDIHGLIGPNGILPAKEYLDQVAQISTWWQKFARVPSLLWLNSGPAGLRVLCWGGLLSAIALLLNLWPRMSLFLCWLFYLSFVTIGTAFSEFQSDQCLLESALLAIFVAPRGLRPGLGENSTPTQADVFMCRWLCFRLMFGSGIGKILSKDQAWRSLSIEDYFQCCPFPTVFSWYMYQLPHFFIACMAALTLLVEIPGAFLIWLGRKPRIIAFLLWSGLQAGIILSGSYHFINYNCIAVALFLLDDQILGLLRLPPIPDFTSASTVRTSARWGKNLTLGVYALLFYISALQLLGFLGLPIDKLPQSILLPWEVAGPFYSVNSYRCYIAINHERNELEFEGSNDGGKTWRTYPFKWQPQKLDASLRFQAPWMPKFDWHLAFTELQPSDLDPLVINTARRLIAGEDSVTRLFADDPFKDKAPSMIRFPLYRFHFTDWSTHRKTGNYWRRQLIKYYAPIVFKDPADGLIKVAPPGSRDRLVNHP